MSLISPIQVVAMRYLQENKEGKVAFVVGLSHQVRNFNKLDITLVDKQGNKVEIDVSTAVASRRDLSTSWKVEFDASHVEADSNSFTISIARGEDGSAETIEGHKLFRKFFLHIDVNHNVETDKYHTKFEHGER